MTWLLASLLASTAPLGSTGDDASSRIETAWSAPPRPVLRPPPEPQSGRGMLTGGIVLTVLGVPLFAAGVRVVAQGFAIDGPGTASAWGPVGALFVLPGAILLAAGVPLTAVGGVRFARWRRWQSRYSVAVQPRMTRSPAGAWMIGLALRF